MTITKINGNKLAVKDWQGQRVVTFKDIDMVHQRPTGTAKHNFNNNISHFEKDVDYKRTHILVINKKTKLT